MKLGGQLSTLVRQQKYFRTRENRNFSTVRSTEKRIFNLNIIEGGLMVAMAGLQVFIVKMFFTGGRKGKPLRDDMLENAQNANPRSRVCVRALRWPMYILNCIHKKQMLHQSDLAVYWRLAYVCALVDDHVLIPH